MLNAINTIEIRKDNSTQAVTRPLNLMCEEERLKQFSLPERIASTGNQNDKVVEAFIVHLNLMEMYLCIFVMEALQNSAIFCIFRPKSKYHYLAGLPLLPRHSPGQLQAFRNFFLQVCNCMSCGQARKM